MGVKAVITTANSSKGSGDDNVESVDLQGNRDLIDAASGAGVEQFIFTSSMKASEDSPVPFFKAKAKTENHLRESGMTFTILSPNSIMEVWVAMVVGAPVQADQPVTLVGDANHKHSFVSMADVVEFAAAFLENPAAENAKILIGGPEPFTWREVVEVYEDVLGREIQINLVAPGEPVPGLSEGMAGGLAGLENFDSPMDMAETSSTFGVKLTPLKDYVRTQYADSEH